MTCQSCGKPKQTIVPRNSSVMKGVTILVCESCKEKKFEPRSFIVIVGRSKGYAAVRDQIVKRLYVGDEITAIELTP